MCWTAGEGRRKKKVMWEKDATELEDSQEIDAGGMGWMERFSGMKVGPPRHAKPKIRSTKGMGENLRSGGMGFLQRKMTRPARLEMKKKLK